MNTLVIDASAALAYIEQADVRGMLVAETIGEALGEGGALALPALAAAVVYGQYDPRRNERLGALVLHAKVLPAVDWDLLPSTLPLVGGSLHRADAVLATLRLREDTYDDDLAALLSAEPEAYGVLADDPRLILPLEWS